MAICLNRSSVLMKWSYSGSTCLLALMAMNEKKTRGFKPGKDKLKVLLCSNVDFLIKPMLLHRLRNLCPLIRGCEKCFPGYMMGNHNIGITEKRFLGWFLKYCILEVKQHLNQKLLNSMLLILDTDKSTIVNASLCVKIISIPPSNL